MITTARKKGATPRKSNARLKGRSPFPKDIQPMLATLVDKPLDEPGWLYELKWDGYRALSYINNGKIDIRSRNNKSFNETYYPVYNALKQWDVKAVVDGEIAVVDENGFSDFADLQAWRSEADGQLMYYVFDLLWLDGVDLMQQPLIERRNLLRSIMPPDDGIIRLSENFDASGAELFAATHKIGLEGIIAKKSDSKYVPGTRSKEWLKIKTEQRQEAIIGGYTLNEGTNKLFSALLLGLHENGEFRFIGPVGTGFNKKMQEEILRKLQPLVIKKCPFSEEPDYNKPSRFRPNPPKAEVTWVSPKVVVEISYRELTKDGSIRHPSFKGLREDKTAKEVRRELPQHIESVKKEEKTVLHKNAPAPKKERKTLLNPADETQVRSVGGHELKFTNLSKIYWPKENVTKRDMINYYYQVAPYMLPYMKDRPQTLNRFPHGIHGESFYQKDVKGKVPGWMTTFPYYSEADQREKEFLVISNEAGLLYVAALGCIEINPWSSRIESPDNPDWCIIDLDPDKNPFDQVIRAAQVTKDVLDNFDIPAYCKTSGSTGLHIYIPLGAKYTYEDSKEFGRKIAKLVHRELPEFTSIERLTEKRRGKLYLDFLQNRPQATVAGPYSLRPKPAAPASAPLHWDEVKKGLRIQDFNIFNMMDRLKETGDLFKGVLGKGINLEKIDKKLEGYL
ncbi:MAG TPA: DNA ligase D [Chitinophagaceae bacterium]|nr:DNA ligase D [Chitinophagaceae bacterium]